MRAKSGGGSSSTNSPLTSTFTPLFPIWLNLSAVSVERIRRQVNTSFSAAPRSWKYGKPQYRDMWRNEPGLRTTFATSFFLTRTQSNHDIPIVILIGTTLASVQRYHHAFTRENQTFEPRMVLAAVDLAITQARAQLAEKKRQSEEREPLSPVELPFVDNNFSI